MTFICARLILVGIVHDLIYLGSVSARFLCVVCFVCRLFSFICVEFSLILRGENIVSACLRFQLLFFTSSHKSIQAYPIMIDDIYLVIHPL